MLRADTRERVVWTAPVAECTKEVVTPLPASRWWHRLAARIMWYMVAGAFLILFVELVVIHVRRYRVDFSKIWGYLQLIFREALATAEADRKNTPRRLAHLEATVEVLVRLLAAVLRAICEFVWWMIGIGAVGLVVHVVLVFCGW